MPLYEYKCQACGRTEELLQSLDAPGRHGCSACGEPQGMQRQLSVPALASQETGFGSGPTEAPPCAAGGGCEGACPYAS
jgi:putative FmdB family regulatory protein